MIRSVDGRPKPRLLSPVNSYEGAVGVISSGADEIYCGVKIPGVEYLGLGTRPSWVSVPDYGELEKIVRHAHENGVETVVTTDLPFMAKIVEKQIKGHILSCVKTGIDALIASDIGILLMMRKMNLDVPIYASTYLGSMNYEAVDFLRKLGVRRVILERHLTIGEIRQIVRRSNGVEIEVFVHGAGCSNINANCYGCVSVFPAALARERAQRKNPGPTGYTMCTFPYDIYEVKGEGPVKIMNATILDAFTFCSLCRLPELIKTGATGFKIVGRETSREFQASVTRLYRKLIDLIRAGEMESYRDELKRYMEGNSMQQVLCREKRCYYGDFLNVPYEIPFPPPKENIV